MGAHVAPHAGAWIETGISKHLMRVPVKSPLMRGRGLKPVEDNDVIAKFEVAPHAGAWIETPPFPIFLQPPSSPLMRGRGLKLALVTRNSAFILVAPHAGAWIETL